MINSNTYSGRSTNGGLDSASLAAVAGRPVDRHGPEAGRQTLSRFRALGRGALLCVAYPLLAIAPLVILNALRLGADHSTMAQLGINCALVGFTLLSMQFVLTARLPWIEAPFGLDLVLRFHRAMALVIVALLCAHPAPVARARGCRPLGGSHAPGSTGAGRAARSLSPGKSAAAFSGPAI